MSMQLKVGARRYGGWTSVSVTRSIESISGAFSLSVANYDPDKLVEEDVCEVLLDDRPLVTGFIESRAMSVSATDKQVTFTGYDRAQALVANSISQGPWSFRSVDLLQMARTLCKPFGINVSLAKGVTLPAPSSKVVVNPGDSPFDVIAKEASKAGVLVVSNGAGDIALVRSGTGRAAPIVQGRNLLSGSMDYNAGERFYKYVVLASRADDDDTGDATTRTRAEAFDLGVRRKDRVLVIRPTSSMSQREAQAFADWTARTRAAQAETATVTVRGWRQPYGQPWAVNDLTFADVESLDLYADRIISEVRFTLDSSGGEITNLRLMRPDAFLPDPSAKVSK